MYVFTISVIMILFKYVDGICKVFTFVMVEYKYGKRLFKKQIMANSWKQKNVVSTQTRSYTHCDGDPHQHLSVF